MTGSVCPVASSRSRLRSRTTRGRPALLAVLTALGGCGFALDAAPPTVENRCEVDDDCPGARCDASLGMCITPNPEPLDLWLQITPATDPVGGSPTTRGVGPFRVDGPTRQGIVLPAPISVIGDVRGPAGEAVGANVRFTATSSFAGAPSMQVETGTVGDPVRAIDGMLADYALRLQAAREYDVTVEPMGEWAARFPPLQRRLMVPGGGDFVRISFDYPADMQVVSGVIEHGDVEPVDDLLVRAVDLETGRVVSSTSVTGAGGVAGAFDIVLEPGVESWMFRVSGGADNPLFPTLLVDPSRLIGHDVHILVPTLSNVCYVGTVGIAADATGFESVAGAVLDFSSNDVVDSSTRLTGSFHAIVTANAQGEFEAQLLPGTYDVLVTAPRDDLGVLFEVAHVEVPAEGDCLRGQRFELPPRPQLAGEVRTADGRPVPSANVITRALGRAPADGVSPAARYNRPSDTTTGPTGLFTLPLDIGTYDLAIKPPPESGFPWMLRPELTIGRADVTVMDVFELSSPVPLAGTIVEAGPEAAPARGAEIRAFAIVDVDGGGRRAVPVGRTVATQDGTFVLMLPARL